MPLPKIEHPIHEVYLKSLDKNIRFRPFLVKEEKLLLMAKESEDLKEITSTIKQIITNCCLSDDVDIETLPITDLEFFFLNLRARSIGEIVDLQYKCNNKVKDEYVYNLLDSNIHELFPLSSWYTDSEDFYGN
jgi:hypothetical protein